MARCGKWGQAPFGHANLSPCTRGSRGFALESYRDSAQALSSGRSPFDRITAMDETGINIEDRSTKPSVLERNGQWYVTLGGNQGIPVDPELAKVINVALKAQERKYSSQGLVSKKLTEVFEQSSCIRTVLYALGVRTVEQLSNIRGSQSLKDIFETDPNSKTIKSTHVRGALDQLIKRGPAVVGLFIPNISPSTTMPVLTSHAFIVLGKDEDGRYVCFENTGGGADDSRGPFRICELRESLAGYRILGVLPGCHWVITPFSELETFLHGKFGQRAKAVSG